MGKGEVMKMKRMLWIAVLALSYTGTAYAEPMTATAAPLDALGQRAPLLRAETSAVRTMRASDKPALKDLPELKPFEIDLYSARMVDRSA